MEFDSELIDVHPLGTGVWAVTPRRGSGSTSNSGIVDTGQVTAIFDAGQTPQMAKDLRSAARLLTGRDPTHLVNSHGHLDHTIGNRVLGSATIISTERTRDAVRSLAPIWEEAIAGSAWSQAALPLTERADRMPDSPARDELRDEIAFRRAIAEQKGLATLLPPMETFRERFRLPGERAVVLLESAGHTPSDVALWVPSSAVLFTGDLVTVQSHPNLADADLARWRVALDRIEDAGARTVVPGHGPPSPPSACGVLRSYFERIEQAAKSTSSDPPGVPDEYATWAFPSLYLQNLRAVQRPHGSGGGAPSR